MSFKSVDATAEQRPMQCVVVKCPFQDTNSNRHYYSHTHSHRVLYQFIFNVCNIIYVLEITNDVLQKAIVIIINRFYVCRLLMMSFIGNSWTYSHRRKILQKIWPIERIINNKIYTFRFTRKSTVINREIKNRL